MDAKIYPLTFEPQFQDYIWGGRNLEKLFGRRLPPGIVAESWEISGHPKAPTRVDYGFWQGRTLPEVTDALKEKLVGTRSEEMLKRGRFPLLIKLLDANRDLSVQVHPDDAYAQAHEGGELGKTEMWYVLYAKPGTRLIYGLARGVTRRSFQEALSKGSLETQLNYLPIAEGDTIFIPAGTVHALLAGTVVAEIQQNSDTTYRVYDWGRVGPDGKPRPLHIEKALEVINWSQIEPDKVTPQRLEQRDGMERWLLVDCPQFTVEKVVLAEGATFTGSCSGETFEIWGWIKGAGEVLWEGEPLRVEAVRFVLLPATLGAYSIQSLAKSELLRAYIGR
ncbi:MAG: class I mannose-6-phosphate isomerase [Anaerolineae bacterium]|nr:class I mannose-6-phosphate isomerase [Anaerolineae bacterium]